MATEPLWIAILMSGEQASRWSPRVSGVPAAWVDKNGTAEAELPARSFCLFARTGMNVEHGAPCIVVDRHWVHWFVLRSLRADSFGLIGALRRVALELDSA